MQQVADIGEHIEDEKRKQLILIFLTAFLLILPGVGEALDALVDIALISRIITLIGDVGNAALTVYDIVDDPKSVPLAIFGLLLGGVASRSEKSFSDAARIRRGMSDKMIAALERALALRWARFQSSLSVAVFRGTAPGTDGRHHLYLFMSYLDICHLLGPYLGRTTYLPY